jgi:hypothetical protein
MYKILLEEMQVLATPGKGVSGGKTEMNKNYKNFEI